MCGIAGFVDFNGASSHDELKFMGDSITHRGPDAAGRELLESETAAIGLAHQRLSIIDLDQRSNQPLWTSDQRYYLVFNGEIYNFKEVRRRLQDLGEEFTTESDTEVVLKAWEKWNSDCVEHFIGMFAFAIYDREQKELNLVRDRAGVKPLYYSFQEGLFLFGSELKALMNHPRFNKEVDTDSTALFLKYGYYPEPNTVFKDCYKVKAGHVVKLSIKSKTIDQSKYWEILDHFSKPIIDRPEKEIAEELEDLLVKAFKYRMVSDVPVGIFLSGGYDSSAVVALLQKHHNENIKTFTIGFEEAAYNEANYARQVADYLETEHHEQYCTFSDAKSIIPELGRIYDEPFGDSSAIPTLLVSRLAKKHVKVSLSADGGDELFGGYGKYPTSLKYANVLSHFPFKKLSGSVLNLATPVAKSLGSGFNFDRRYKRAVDLLKEGVAPYRAMKLSSQNVLDKELRLLLNKSTAPRNSNYDLFESAYEQLSPLNQLLALDYKTYLVDDILTKVARATMSVALEGREPLLDHNLAQFMAGVPEHLKIKNGQKKYLLKSIVHKYLPKEMMDRPKKGFSVPVKEWMRSDLRELLEDTLSESRVKAVGVFNPIAVENLKANYISGRNEDFNPVWFLFMFHQWHVQWMK